MRTLLFYGAALSGVPRLYLRAPSALAPVFTDDIYRIVDNTD